MTGGTFAMCSVARTLKVGARSAPTGTSLSISHHCPLCMYLQAQGMGKAHSGFTQRLTISRK